MIVPLIYRVYKATVQRVTASIKNLNSNATFIIVVEEEKRITLWVGSQCDDEDAELANTIAETIMKRDFRETDEEAIPIIMEGEESNDVLEPFLDLLWSTMNQYYSKMTAGERKKPLVNSSVSVGYVELLPRSTDTYDFQETAFAHPDQKGTVPRVTFVPIEMNTIGYVNVGDHWDIWCARAVSDEDIEKVMVFVRNTVATQLNLVDNAATRQTNILGQYVHLIRQGEESTLFRRPLKIFTDFEPPGKCAPRPDPAPRMKKEIEKKSAAMLTGRDKTAADKDQEKEGLGKENTASGSVDAGDSKNNDEDDEEIGFSPRSAPDTASTTGSALGGRAVRPPALDLSVKEDKVDFWSVPTGEAVPQGTEEVVYPPINMTVNIKVGVRIRSLPHFLVQKPYVLCGSMCIQWSFLQQFCLCYPLVDCCGCRTRTACTGSTPAAWTATCCA
jgi:hypothetical protein